MGLSRSPWTISTAVVCRRPGHLQARLRAVDQEDAWPGFLVTPGDRRLPTCDNRPEVSQNEGCDRSSEGCCGVRMQKSRTRLSLTNRSRGTRSPQRTRPSLTKMRRNRLDAARGHGRSNGLKASRLSTVGLSGRCPSFCSWSPQSGEIPIPPVGSGASRRRSKRKPGSLIGPRRDYDQRIATRAATDEASVSRAVAQGRASGRAALATLLGDGDDR
jgi:hypothetical protein